MLVNDKTFRALEVGWRGFVNHADLIKSACSHYPEWQTYLESLIYIQKLEVNILESLVVCLQRLYQLRLRIHEFPRDKRVHHSLENQAPFRGVSTDVGCA